MEFLIKNMNYPKLKEQIETLNKMPEQEFNQSFVEEQQQFQEARESRWFDSGFAAYLGQGVAILLICLGIGTCTMLSNSRIDIQKPKIQKSDHNQKH
jgi:hypothetical protein